LVNIEKIDKLINKKGEIKEELESKEGLPWYKFLTDPNLFENLVKELDLTVAGEEPARRALILQGASLFCEGSEPYSSKFHINAESGIGKDHLIKEVTKLFPKDQIIYRKRISETALTYWGASNDDDTKEPFDFDGKWLILEDVEEKVLNGTVLKVCASGGGTSTITVRNKAVSFTIRGNPTITLTSAETTADTELLRRFVNVSLVATEEQTKKICQLLEKKYLEADYFKREDERYGQISEYIQHLKRRKVEIPFAKIIIDVFPTDFVIARTNIKRFFDFIKFSACLHQFQREETDSGAIIANEQDFSIAHDVFEFTIGNFMQMPINHKQKSLLITMHNYQQLRRAAGLDDWLTIAQIWEISQGFEDSYKGKKDIYFNLEKLCDMSFLEKCNKAIGKHNLYWHENMCNNCFFDEYNM